MQSLDYIYTDTCSTIQYTNSIHGLVNHLRNAPDAVLLKHATEHQFALTRVAELASMKIELENFKAAKVEQERDALSIASTIQTDITTALRKQMIYTNQNLKHQRKRITYSRGGVTQIMFDKAFSTQEDYKPGRKETRIHGDDVGTKTLRYGRLSCSHVGVKLNGDTLYATAMYGMD